MSYPDKTKLTTKHFLQYLESIHEVMRKDIQHLSTLNGIIDWNIVEIIDEIGAHPEDIGGLKASASEVITAMMKFKIKADQLHFVLSRGKEE